MAMATLQDLLLSKSATDKFFNRIVVSENDVECWEWVGTKNSQGYGQHYCGIESNKFGRAHRLAYEHWVGPIEEGMTVDHLCYNKSCVNPKHLEVVTRGENARRAHLRITHCPQGHEYTPNNIKATKRLNNERACLTCHRDRESARRAQKALVS